PIASSLRQRRSTPSIQAGFSSALPHQRPNGLVADGSARPIALRLSLSGNNRNWNSLLAFGACSLHVQRYGIFRTGRGYRIGLLIAASNKVLLTPRVSIHAKYDTDDD